MPGESISFDITAKDAASSKFRDVGRAAADTSLKLDAAALSLKAFDEATLSSGKAAKSSEQAFKSHAAATKLLADAENVLAGKATTTTKLLADQGKKVEDAGTAAKKAAGSSGFGALAGIGGGGAWPILIGAGAALAPLVGSLAFGLTGLGIAAYGVIKPIENAAQKTGGLQKNMHLLNPEQQAVARSLLGLGKQFQSFQGDLQPTLFAGFNAGLRLAGHLMHDIEPVSNAVGHALTGVIHGVDNAFQSTNWQQFFAFLTRTAQPDIRLLGSAFTNLLNTLPPIVEELAPLTAGLLRVAQAGTGVLNLAAHVQQLAGNYQNLGNAANYAGKSADTTSAGIQQGLYHVIPALGIFQGKSKEIAAAWNVITGNTQAATGAQAKAGSASKTVAQEMAAEAKALNQVAAGYEKTLGPLGKYINATITSADDEHALKKALDASGNSIGLKTAAQRASFQAAQTYIQDTINQGNAAIGAHKGIDQQIRSIQNALPLLESVKGKTAAYKQELDLLKQILDKLRAEKLITEKVRVFGNGSWSVSGSGVVHGFGGHTANGALIRGGTPGVDSVPIMAMPGEVVVPTRMVNAGAVDHLRGSIPGFAGGGIVGSYGPGSVAGLPPWISHNQQATIVSLTDSIAKSFASSVAQSFSRFGAAGPGGGNPAANAALARRMYPQWAVEPYWGAWNYVAMAESGWNQFAANPSGAYGIPQALPFTKMPRAAWPAYAGGSSNPAAQISWMAGYMASTYGGPLGAAAHEASQHWYDKGGVLAPGWNAMYNGTGHLEYLEPKRGGAQAIVMEVVSGGSGAFEQFMLTAIRKWVRIHGGGDVQRAFGRN